MSKKVWIAGAFASAALIVGIPAVESLIVYNSDQFKTLMKPQEKESPSVFRNGWEAIKNFAWNHSPNILHQPTAADIESGYRSSSKLMLDPFVPDFLGPTFEKVATEDAARNWMAWDIFWHSKDKLSVKGIKEAATAITQGKMPEPEHQDTWYEKLKNRFFPDTPKQ